MVTLSVSRGFYDRDARTHRRPGDSFTATEARADAIERALPGYVNRDAAPTEEPAETDLNALKVAELRAMCKERGIEAPRGATKNKLVALLGG